MSLNPDLFTSVYKPDVLSCLADLSNDEVFTPPDVANKMLDMLPQELFRDPNTKFLDPACKSGVFLREIAKRLIAGLADKISNLQERCDWIFKNQLYGIAITELTSLLSRRSVYCSKYPNSPFSITQFDNVQGNIIFHKIKHTWQNKKCIYCGTAENGDLNDIAREGMESHAYEFIHTLHPEEIFNMKFDVIVGNPPYQLNDGGNAASASPIYQYFVKQAIKLNPRYLTLIIPARWYAGGKGLDDFRESMLQQQHISQLVDVANSADCFPGVNIAGGICYFLWERDYKGNCNIKNMKDGEIVSEKTRPLNEFKYFVRDNTALGIIHKVLANKPTLLSSRVYSRNYFSVSTTAKGLEKPQAGYSPVLTSKGVIFIKTSDLDDKDKILSEYKVIMTYAMSGGNKPGSDGKYMVTSSVKVLKPGEACSETYLIIDHFKDAEKAENLRSYILTKFFRFLLLQALTSIHITKDKFCFVPVVNYEESWDDQKLYKTYSLTKDEIDVIESSIKELDGGED